MPGAIGSKGTEEVVESGSAGQGIGGKIAAKEDKPFRDKRSGRAPAGDTIALGGKQSETVRSEGGGRKRDGLADTQEKDVGHEQEAVKPGFDGRNEV